MKIHRIAVNGSSVLTERTDALVFGPVRLQFWVCGVFEVTDGRITLWRDYFDMFDITKAIARGVVGAVIPGAAPPAVGAVTRGRPEFLERLRPAQQPIGGIGRVRRGSAARISCPARPRSPTDTSCAAAVTISLY